MLQHRKLPDCVGRYGIADLVKSTVFLKQWLPDDVLHLGTLGSKADAEQAALLHMLRKLRCFWLKVRMISALR